MSRSQSWLMSIQLGQSGPQLPISSAGVDGWIPRTPWPEYEVAALNTRVFHLGSFGALWRERSSEDEAAEGDDAVMAEDSGCTPETTAVLRAVCKDPDVIPKDTNLVTLD
uniref:Uncharacterized protein n=1 Tax=Sphenodon punctatus TaxID=8508 RepID=A0A8D0HM96_SPHPU